MLNKRGQVAIFIIIALVIVGGVATYFIVRNQLAVSSISPEFQPLYAYYLSCIEDQTRDAVNLAESQGGRIFTGDYVPGSEYAPFSSQLNFLGFPVPYWYYIAGNGVIKESVPKLSEVESEISEFISGRLNENCNFDSFYSQGYEINPGVPGVDVSVQADKVVVEVDSDFSATFAESSVRKSDHRIELGTRFGTLFNSAQKIYGYQKANAVLENYSADVLRLYAPVDGVEISCSGKIWKTREVVDDLKSALEANIASLKFSGDYYSLKNKEQNYFVIPLSVNEQVNLIYSKNWPSRIEIFGADDELMIAQPVGTQGGMGAMGFCYSPYHFLYDLSYPVLIQVMDGEEIFQFPVVVVVDNNMPRERAASLPLEESEALPSVCDYKTNEVTVNVYDSELNPIDANLSYSCFDERCNLGSSVGGVYSGMAPACYNGYLNARANGYAEKSQIFSTNEEISSDIILDREYDVVVELEVGGKSLDGTAIVVFSGEHTSSTSLPDSKTMGLSEGLYNVTVYVYGNSTITIPASSKEHCFEVSSGGLFGLFGSTKQECKTVTIPETKIDAALIGGGRSEIYVLPSDLKKGKITLKVDSFPIPDSLEKLQGNYALFDAMGVELAI